MPKAALKKPRGAYLKKLLAFFDEYYPDAACSLQFKTPFELLAATILSAQCTDERVNQTTPALFKKYPGPMEMGRAELEDVERLVKPCGFYHNKAMNLIESGRLIAEVFGGQVPPRLEDLITLPGVGRKTANVVLGNAFGVPGLTVDTHLGRLSRRMGLSQSQNPVEVEKDLAALIPQKRWTLFSHQAISHGRAVCRARKPLCEECGFLPNCPRII